MKKTFVILFITVVGYACGGDASKNEATADSANAAGTTPEAPAAPAKQDPSENPDYQKGLELIAKSDCLTCHKVEEKAVGPAYREVANKYASDDQTITLLADKILKGGKGVWGEVPMTPHPTLTVDDAKQMVKYILLLKTN